VSRKYTGELLRAPDDVLSFVEAIREVGLLRLNFSLTYPIIVLVDEKRRHSWRVPRKGSMTCQHYLRISEDIQFYVERLVQLLFQLVRNLPNILGSVHEEIRLAFEDKLSLEGHSAFYRMFRRCADVLLEWREVRIPPAIRRIVSRVSNRVFVGPPLCKILDPIILVSLRSIFHRPMP